MDVKLIDILVRELPKRGGWPEGCDVISTNGYGAVWAYKTKGCVSGRELYFYASPEGRATREQYEAALAASKPEWDGEGLPPVGCRVEANYGGEWVEATVAYTDRPEGHSDAVTWKEALVFDCKTTRPFWADEFRPIRSEADKKKEEAATCIMKQLLIRREVAEAFVKDISAGNIPHIRID